MDPSIPTVDLTLWGADAIVLFDWLNGVDLNAIPVRHPAEKQALVDLLTRLEVDTNVPYGTSWAGLTQSQIDESRAEVADGTGWSTVHGSSTLDARGPRRVGRGGRRRHGRCSPSPPAAAPSSHPSTGHEHGIGWPSVVWVELVDRLVVRAERRSFYGHPAALQRLHHEKGAVRGGVSAAADHDVDLVDGDLRETYFPEQRLGALIERYALDDDAERPNVLIHAVDDADWPFDAGVEFAPSPVVAVDLLESEDERARRAGRELAERHS